MCLVVESTMNVIITQFHPYPIPFAIKRSHHFHINSKSC